MRIDVHYFPKRIDVLVVADAFAHVACVHSENQVEADCLSLLVAFQHYIELARAAFVAWRKGSC